MDDFDFLDELDDEEDMEFNDLPLDDEFIRDHFSNVPESVIENFPFVEDNVDAITDYELFSKGFGYLDDKKADKEELSEYVKKDEIPPLDDFVTKDTQDLTYYTKTSDLSDVALTGEYDDLLNKPELFSGDYNDLTNKPTVPTKTSDLTNDSGYITKDVNDLTNYTLSTSLATVATTGNYNDLSNKPTIPDVSNFITKDVNDLTYYTLTSDLYGNDSITSTNTSFELTDTINTTLKTTLYGNTNQNGIPTPDNPVNLNVVSGDNTITISNEDNTESQSYPINLGTIELYKIEDYQDSIFYNTNDTNLDLNAWYIKKNIGKVVLNGSEASWTINNNSVAGGSLFTIDITDIMLNNSATTIGNVKSNYFTPTSPDSLWKKLENGFTNLNNRKSLRFRYIDKTTLNDFKTWLGTHNTTVYYVLASPTYTKINDTTLIEQLNKLYSATSYDTQTTISQTNNDLPFNINVVAYIKNINGIYKGLNYEISLKTNKTDLATVATSGSYNDLSNKPTIPPTMSILSYGSSTWNDFITAYNSKSIVYCRASSNSNPATGSQTRLAFMAYVNNETTPTEVEFQYYRSVNTHSDSQQGDQVFVYKLTSASGGTWTVTTRNAFSKVVAGTNLSSSYSNGVITLNNTLTASDLNTYSSSETVCGKWIDNKPIYRRVFTLTSQTSPALVFNNNIDLGLSNIGTFTRIDGILKTGDNYNTIPAIYVENDALVGRYNMGIYRVADSLLYIGAGSYYTENLNSYTLYLIVEYTKSTD